MNKGAGTRLVAEPQTDAPNQPAHHPGYPPHPAPLPHPCKLRGGRRRVGGGYLWARTSGEGATSPHRDVDEVRPRHENVEKDAPTTLNIRSLKDKAKTQKHFLTLFGAYR
jgi:hypothetical protein